jgi:7-cyano-7-deazaguanine synthase
MVSLISGGTDGAIAAALLKEEGYEHIYALTAAYGQRSERKELACAKKLSKWLGAIELKTIRMHYLQDFGGSAVFEKEKLTRANNFRQYVPLRNTVLLAAGTAWAEALDADAVSIGSNCDDTLSPDNTLEYTKAVEQVVYYGSRKQDIEILAPFLRKGYGKVDVIKLGDRMHFPFENSWSCLNSSKKACGECGNCISRYFAFRRANLTDPLSYEVVPRTDV